MQGRSREAGRCPYNDNNPVNVIMAQTDRRDTHNSPRNGISKPKNRKCRNV